MIEADALEPRDRSPAAVWRPVLASILDVLTVLFAVWALAVLQIAWFLPALVDRYAPEPWGRMFVPTLVISVSLAIYQGVFVRYNEGQTPGMDVSNVRVVWPVRTPGVWASAVRASLASVPMLVPPFGAGLALVLLSAVPMGRGRRSATDRINGTRIVYYNRDREDLAAAERPPFPRRRGRTSLFDTQEDFDR